MTDDLVPSPGGRSKRGFLALMLVGFSLMIGLGSWQLDRLSWKEALIAERQAMLAASPVDLQNGVAGTTILPHRRVRLTGEFLHKKERLVGPRTRRGFAGWDVLTPLRLSGGGVVLINRGWVPHDRKDPARRLQGQVAGIVALEGIIKRSGKRGAFVPDNDPVRNQWFDVDPAAMAMALGLSDVAPYWVIVGPAPNPGGYPKGGGGGGMPANNHLQYAGTWFGLALVLVVCSLVYWRRA